MSLINDALKRASHAQRRSSPPPLPGTQLRPVDSPISRRFGLGWWLLLLVGTVLAVAIPALWAGRRSGSEGKATPLPNRESQAPLASAPSSPPQDRPVRSSPNRGLALATAETSAPVQSVAAPPTKSPPTINASAVVPEASQPVQALPKLQGILYRTDRPSALLNNKAVSIGDRSGEFLVVAIDRKSVTLVRTGRTNVLRLAE